MAAPESPASLEPGLQCLLTVTENHFMVKILDVSEDSLHVSFPAADYPVEGMFVELEVHDAGGFSYYRSVVIKGPQKLGDGVILRKPEGPSRNVHRACCRVPTDIVGKVRDDVHVKKYPLYIRNISAGGALIEAFRDFRLNTSLELSFSLREKGDLNVLAEVVHVTEIDVDTKDARLYGIRFVGLDPEIRDTLNTYIWERLRELYPT